MHVGEMVAKRFSVCYWAKDLSPGHDETPSYWQFKTTLRHFPGVFIGCLKWANEARGTFCIETAWKFETRVAAKGENSAFRGP